MRNVLITAACFALITAPGCRSKPAPAAAKFSTPPGTVATAPAKSPTGRIVKVNPNGRFLVVSFPPAQMPAPQSIFAVFRGGNKVAEVRISGPQLDDNIVADLITGNAEVGDEVREN